MPEARDRISRPEKMLLDQYLRRRQTLGQTGILADSESEGIAGSPFRWGSTPLTGIHQRGQVGVAPRTGRGGGHVRGAAPRSSYRSPALNRQNQSNRSVAIRGRSRGGRRNSVLPLWYPRVPLQDITTVVRAIEGRRVRLRESEGQQLESPLPQRPAVHNPPVHDSGAQLEHDLSFVTPNPKLLTRLCPTSVGSVSKILLDITKQKNIGEPDFLTPQKKLLDSIDTVSKVVMEELRKLEKTPAAKKAAREKRVRTLMSMR